jgi:hypothetical protein
VSPRAAVALLLLLSLAACSPEPPRLHLEITAGQEKDTFSMDPSVVRLDIKATSVDGSTQVQASAVPGGSFDLGEVPADQFFGFEVSGVTGSGTTVVRGRSLSGISLSGGEGSIPIFVARPNRWSRPPGGLLHTHVAAPAGVRGEQYVYLGGGAAAGEEKPAGTDFYDLFSLQGSTAAAFPRLPETIVSRPQDTLLINAEGATAIDDLGAIEISPPEGLSFADVAGGRPVEAADGRIFVVGATRRDKPTRAVLIVAADASLHAAFLAEARAGAAALWVKGVGLMVAGGSAGGAGVELLAEGSTSFSARGYPADPVEGAGAVLDGNGGVALIGGAQGGAAAPTRRLDPACATDCSVEELSKAALPAPLGGVSVFALGGGRSLVVGDELGGQGMTRSFLVDLGGAVEELGLRAPRRGASVIPAPNGTLALLGGLLEDGAEALSVELLFPE